MGANIRLNGTRDEVPTEEPLRDFELGIFLAFLPFTKVENPSSPGLLDYLALD